MRFEGKLGSTNLKPKRIYLYIMNLIRNHWEHILRNESSQKSFLKTFCYNNQGPRKMTDLQNLFNNQIYFTVQSNNTKYIKHFNYISWADFKEGYHNLSPDVWGKICTDLLTKCSGGYIVSICYKFIHFSLLLNPAIHKMVNLLNILCPWCR